MKSIRLLLAILFMFSAIWVSGQTEKEQASKIKSHLSELFKVKNNVSVAIHNSAQEGYVVKGETKNIFVLDDRIEFQLKGFIAIIYFSEIIDNLITNAETTGNSEVLYMGNAMLFINDKGIREKIEGDCKLLQDLYWKKRNEELILFKSVADQYRLLKIKPAVSEEQRKFIVQANMFNQEKDYEKAISFYNIVIKIDQTSFPAAYCNLALLSAQLFKYHSAIYNMKKYLMLEPEAIDGRNCQDKIYEWEAKISK